MFLDDVTFSSVIEHSPLVSIDLIVRNEQEKVLLGMRRNRPAQVCWFVPGGRIRKGESLESAFQRLTCLELGLELSISEAVLLGPYTHLYKYSVFSDEISTHYVVIAYELSFKEEELRLPSEDQHHSYCWMDKTEILSTDTVHQYTKLYFEKK